MNENLDVRARELMAHPLAQRYARRILAGGDSGVHTPEDVLGERRVRLATLLRCEYTDPGKVILIHTEGLDTGRLLLGLTEFAIKANPYLWTEETRLMVIQQKIPRHVISPRILPEPLMWWTHEAAIPLHGELLGDGVQRKGLCDAILIQDNGIGIAASFFGQYKDDEGVEWPLVTGAMLKYGQTFPDDFEHNQHLYEFAEGTLLWLAFLNSPYIPKKKSPPARAARREIARAGYPAEEEVTFVILRRPSVRKEKTDEEFSSVEWKHRWIVNGHLRAQWYPSEQAHHLIWIAPYWKGPDDAPPLEHVYKVAR